MSDTTFQCAPWCANRGTDDEGHRGYILRGDQSCWGPQGKTVFGLEEGTPALGVHPAPCDSPGIAVYAYQGWYELPKVKLNVFRDSRNEHLAVDADFYLTPSEAVELAGHLIAVVETIAGVKR